jgi:hypothetical protein
MMADVGRLVLLMHYVHLWSCDEVMLIDRNFIIRRTSFRLLSLLVSFSTDNSEKAVLLLTTRICSNIYTKTKPRKIGRLMNAGRSD